MIKLRDVGKTYVSKSGHEVRALKNVNFELGNVGMVFILGKSGSGKSTLLNILGGLDVATDGEVIVDGTSMKNFTQLDYDGYRNGYAGFIFQEYNLLDDFDVKENIALALQLEQDADIDGKVAEALRQVELPEEYLTHRVGELSGGEKQRVAIARCLVKNSKIILADEPTGNLDSSTGTSIWNLLKKLSQKQLVVVVSHDRKSAEKYADRIIEISDGEVISDSNADYAAGTDVQEFVAVRKRLPFKTRFKIAWNTIKLRKGKTVSVILLAVFGILSLLLTQLCLCFSSEKTLAKFIQQKGIEYFSVEQGKISKYDNMTYGNELWKNDSKQYIDANCKYISNNIVRNKQEILDFGLTFIGDAFELDDNSFYATSTQINELYEYHDGEVEVNGEYVDIVREFHPISFLIGKKIKLYTIEGVLAGVIDTEHLNNTWAVPGYFYNQNFDVDYSNLLEFNSPTEMIVNYGDKSYTGRIWFKLDSAFASIVTADGIKTLDEIKLSDNEIVLSYDVYSRFFDASSMGYYISNDLTEVRNIPKEIGQSFRLCFYDPDEQVSLLDCGEVRLVGVSFCNPYIGDSVKYAVTVNEQLIKKISGELTPYRILIQTASVRDLVKFVTTLRNKHQVLIARAGLVKGQADSYSEVAYTVYDFEEIMRVVSWVFIAMCILLTAILILLVINLISLSIAARKREVGILSALGTSNRDITSIFIIETLIISVITFVIVLALILTLTPLINYLFGYANGLAETLPFIRVGFLTITVLVLSSFGLLLLAALLPLKKIVKMKPIDAIRNN